MGVYLRAKFEVSSIILTGFRQGAIPPHPPATSKRTPKKPNQIRVTKNKGIANFENYFVCSDLKFLIL